MVWFVLISICWLASVASSFNFTTASVADVHTAIQTGKMSCRQIIQGYLDRVNAYDSQGPNIHAMVTVNQHALSEAINLDNYVKITGKLTGILHCAPVIIKDNIDATGLPTTAGWNALKVRY